MSRLLVRVLAVVMALGVGAAVGSSMWSSAAADPVDNTYTAVAPCAVADSRPSQGATGGFAGPYTHGVARSVQITGTISAAQGTGGATTCAIPTGSDAVLVNVVAVNPTQSGNLRAYATGTPPPNGGIVNFAALAPTPLNTGGTAAIPLPADGRLDVSANCTAGACTDVRVIVLGYYSDALANRVAQLEALLQDVTRIPAGVGGQPTLRFTGVNVQIVNGQGDTYSANGRGNLIVGYAYAFGAAGPRTGSHNLIVGDSHGWSGSGGVVFGEHSSITGKGATVLGGESNQAGGTHATVVGGSTNQAPGRWTAVLGGGSNTAGGDNATVSGGINNAASGSSSAVAGGDANKAIGSHASVAGGTRNDASGAGASVAGGSFNIASGSGSAVAGGYENDANGIDCSIANRDVASMVAGGQFNVASGCNAAVLGGGGNVAKGQSTTVAGGRNNTATGAACGDADAASTVSGGKWNVASGCQATVSGGGGPSVQHGNYAVNNFATVSGGQARTANGDADWVAGGLFETS